MEEISWVDIEKATLVTVLSKDCLAAPETSLFDGMDRWAGRECERRGMKKIGDTKRVVLGDAVYLIRYLSLSAAEFAAGPAQSGILPQQESFSILMNISCPGSWDIPDHMAKATSINIDSLSTLGLRQANRDSPPSAGHIDVSDLALDRGGATGPWQGSGAAAGGLRQEALVQAGHDAGAALPQHLHPGLLRHFHCRQGCLHTRTGSAEPSHRRARAESGELVAGRM